MTSDFAPRSHTAVAQEHRPGELDGSWKLAFLQSTSTVRNTKCRFFKNQMRNLLAQDERQINLAPGLLTIIEAAEAAGWAVKRGNSSVELVKPASRPEASIGYAINSKWWCKHLGNGTGKSFRVTAPDLLQLLGLPTQE